MKNNKFNFQDVLKYFIKLYNINKAKTIGCKNSNNYSEIVLKDKDNQVYFITVELKENGIITFQKLGNNYKDFYEINYNEIFLFKRVYKDDKNEVFIEKVYPNDIEYSILKANNVTYFNLNRTGYETIKINNHLYRSYTYHFKNSNLDCLINLNIPMKLIISEKKVIKYILKKETTIKKLEDLLSFLEIILGNDYQNICINIKSTKLLNKIEEKSESYDGLTNKRKQIIEEESVEYSPFDYIKNNKVKRR